MKPPQNTQYLFIDMNAFFASCEQQNNPLLRGKPVAVTPVNVSSGCIIAASYEAKKIGIKTGTKIVDAKFMCPDIVITESNVPLYIDFHKRLLNVLHDFSPFLTVKSIDEAVIKLSPNEKNSQSAQELALKIKEKIKNNLGEYMKSSIGIGPNIWLAKMAAESKKPDGLVEVKLENLTEFYKTLKLTDLKGINFRMEKQLNKLGIYRPIDLYLTPAEELRKKLGIWGEGWFLRMRGFDIDTSKSKNKTIGQSHVLEPIFRKWPCAWQVCQKLTERAGKRLRSEKLIASGVHLHIRYLGRNSWNKGVKTSSFSDSQTFLKLISTLWSEAPKDFPPLGIGVRAYNLTKLDGYQLKIFSEMQKIDNLYKAIDKVNDKFGDFTLKPANILPVNSSAPKRIAFNHLPE